MVWQASPAAASAFRSLRFGLLAFVAAFVAHDAVFAVHYGLRQRSRGGPARERPRRVLGRRGGRGRRDRGSAGRRGRHAGRLAAPPAAGPPLGGPRFDHGDTPRPDTALDRGEAPRPYRRELVGLWLRLFAVVAVAFTVQENVEHAAHHHFLGIGALWSQEYPFAAGTLAAVTFAAAAIGALARCRIAALDLQVARASAASGAGAARRPRGVRPPAGWSLTAAAILLHWTIARQDPGRAPPEMPLPA